MTPINVDAYEALLNETGYDPQKVDFLVKGFRNGFSRGYTGNERVTIQSPNLKFAVGDEITLWNKVMKEIKLKYFAGPFEKIPFKFYIQSPIGLVPKDNGNDTRLIFHLSYPRNGTTSVNYNTDPALISVKYPDFSEAIKLCIAAGKNCNLFRSDFQAAFRNLNVLKRHWKFLVMKARNPVDGKWYYMVDKVLPFGHSVSCALFQEFSNSVAHIVIYFTHQPLVNYLDDYLFVALMRVICNRQMHVFLDICKRINFPVNEDKTFWASTTMTFLGFLIDSVNQLVGIPCEKVAKATNMINYVLNKDSKKLTVFELQRICGFLNFLGRAILPGRAFTRHLYSHLKNNNLKPHHHLRISGEMCSDLRMWLQFLQHPSVYCRSFMDFDTIWHADGLDFYSDLSRNPFLGMRAKCNKSWMCMAWDAPFIIKYQPSIEYLELYAVTAAVVAWIGRFRNRRVVIFCDNQACVVMINNMSSNCKNCMVLIRIIVLQGLINNVHIFARYVKSKENTVSDLLSRLRIKKFKEITKGKEMEDTPTSVPNLIHPMKNIWLF